MASMLYDNIPYIVAGTVGVLTLAFVLKKILSRPKVYNDPRDLVILCILPRGPSAPSFSPFPIKLETYMRAAKIPHKVVFDRGMSPKNKTPWIMLNGEAISDSQLCIEFLNKKFDVDLDKSLNAKEKAISRAFRKMIEESYYWSSGLERWTFSDRQYLIDAFKPMAPISFLTPLLVNHVSKLIKKAAYGQGMGRHSPEEVREFGLGDLKAVSDFLGTKPFLMGDTLTEVDCAVFGFLCQAKFHSPGLVYEKAVTKDFPNLSEYVERVKAACWENWDDCITHNHTRKATA